jgi:hypothetical protein
MSNSTYAFNGLGRRLPQDVSGNVIRYPLDMRLELFQTLTRATSSTVARRVHVPTGVSRYGMVLLA